MKKSVRKPFSIILLFIVSTLLIGILAGCGEEDADATTVATTKEITTTTTSTPLTTPSAPTTTTAAPVTTTAPITPEPQTTVVPVTTEKTPETNPPATEPAEPLPPLEITIPIPDAGEMAAELEAEIIAASAKQYDEDPKDLSVEFVADLGGGAYAIFIDGMWPYVDMETEQIVHGYLFWYSSGRTMWIYKDGAVYGLSKAYEQGVIDAKQVLNLYLIYADQMGYLSVRNPEKFYTGATIDDNFYADEIIIVVFPEYTLYPYTVKDFAEIGCVELRNLWFDEDDPTEARIISLTLDKVSKQNVLDCIRILEHRADLESAEPSFIIEIDDAFDE